MRVQLNGKDHKAVEMQLNDPCIRVAHERADRCGLLVWSVSVSAPCSNPDVSWTDIDAPISPIPLRAAMCRVMVCHAVVWCVPVLGSGRGDHGGMDE